MWWAPGCKAPGSVTKVGTPLKFQKTQPFSCNKLKFIPMKLKVYYAYILDHKGAPVMQTRFCTSSRQAAAVANQIIEKCPPAMGFNIRFREVDIKEIAELLNGAFLFFYLFFPTHNL